MIMKKPNTYCEERIMYIAKNKYCMYITGKY